MQFHLYTAGSTTYTQISQVTTDQRNKPLMRQILRFTEESEICGSTSVQLVQLPTHSNTQDVLWLETLELQNRRENQRDVVPPLYSWFNYLHTLISQVFLWLETLEAPRIDGTIEWIIESEQCSSHSIQLVQLPKPSNIPGVSMVRNTGDSEDHQSYKTDKRIREMWSHLYTAGSTTYTF